MRWPEFVLGSLAVLTAGAAAAQEPSLDLRRLRPSTDANASVALEPTTTPSAGNLDAGWLLSYGYRLVTVTDQRGREVGVPVRHQLSTDALFSMGVGRRIALGLDVPAILLQKGDTVAAADLRVPHTALGDVGLSAKATLIPRGPLGGFGLASIGTLTLPTGDPTSTLGGNNVSGELRFLSELDLLLASVRASAGVHLVSRKRTFLGDRFGHELPWAVGLVLRPQALGWDPKGHWQWFLEGRGALAITPRFGAAHASPAALGLGARQRIGKDWSWLMGVEAPLDGAVGVPSLRAVLGVSWAPRFEDADDDGIPDDADDCPEEMPEDRDGIEDDDGCPEDDVDGDGLSDAADGCPLEAEDLDAYRDQDGCPDPDNDGDQIPDAQDACPDQPGQPSKSKAHRGCVIGDSDSDGIPDDRDLCPNRPEDQDGHHDDDGCPDPDNDGDGVLDTVDDCPKKRGVARPVPGLNGCPDPDRDADTYFGTHQDAFALGTWLTEAAESEPGPRDRCPDEAEDFDGDRDEDGCPDPSRPGMRDEPLLRVELSGNQGSVRFLKPPRTEGAMAFPLPPGPSMVWRALGRELKFHPDWTAFVGVRPKGTADGAAEQALQDANTLVDLLRRLAMRDNAATAVSFAAVAEAPGANASGIGVAIQLGARRKSPPPRNPPTPPPASPGKAPTPTP